MEKEELIKELEKLYENPDTEDAHFEADNLIIDYIDDREIKEAYENVSKWYA
jgi:hypothetical protein